MAASAAAVVAAAAGGAQFVASAVASSNAGAGRGPAPQSAGRVGIRGEGSRSGTSRGRDSSTGQSTKNKPPSQYARTITPRKSATEVVPDRQVFRAPWEQGGDAGKGSSVRDYTKKNPLIERLQRMQEEVDDEEGGENPEGAAPSVDDSSSPFDGKFEKSAMARIVEKLSNIPGSGSVYEPKSRRGLGSREGPDSAFGATYGQPTTSTGGSRDWSASDHLPAPAPAAPAKKFRPDTRFPWEREEERREEEAPERKTRVKAPSLAELTLSEDELKRMRSLGVLLTHRIKVGKLGVTNGIVDSIHNEWRNSEVARVKCEGMPARNMKRTHETLEERTGGLVIWRAGGACLIYRGKDYVRPPERGPLDLSNTEYASTSGSTETGLDEANGVPGLPSLRTKVRVPRLKSIYDPELEQEMEDILSTLGPRYDDWTGTNPVPVDADLLEYPHAKFKKPFRRLPFGVRASLTNLELTNLRRLARPLPPHFVLGINRGLEGLADAIVKLWQKSEIAKVAVKRGVQNTNHERMGEQLKRLTGGVLLARDKFFIVLYRGKDFLPTEVAAALEERQAMTTVLQEEEEQARLRLQSKEVSDSPAQNGYSGTLAETLAARANWERLQNGDEERRSRQEAERAIRREMGRRIERKMFITSRKKEKAERELEKVEKRLRPATPPVDRENITDEERHMFSKLGMKMHAFLLLGRRGIFGGTIENMHLHWKHRQLVKIIYKAMDKVDLEQTARMLEYESGGILVATAPTSKGQAIILYRGKNYQRPPELRPRTLLTKRQALKRSIEMQRQQGLTRHLMTLESQIEQMQLNLAKLEDEDQGSLELTLDNSEDSEELISGFDADDGGLSKAIAGLSTAIREHFEAHALVKMGFTEKLHDAPTREILNQLEEATAGEVISYDASKVILYRGWTDEQERPVEGRGRWKDIPSDKQIALMSEIENDDDYLHESDWDESEDDDEEEDEDEELLDERDDIEAEDGLMRTEATLDSAELATSDSDESEENSNNFDPINYDKQLSRS